MKLGRSDDEFYHSSLNKVMTLIDLWIEEQEMKVKAYSGESPSVKAVRSFKDIEGMV